MNNMKIEGSEQAKEWNEMENNVVRDINVRSSRKVVRPPLVMAMNVIHNYAFTNDGKQGKN